MARVTFPAFFLLVVASIAAISDADDCRIADGAIRYDDTCYLFMGPDVITLDGDGVESDVDNKEDDWGGLQRLDAAMMWKDGDSWYHSWYPVFFEGASYSYYSYSRGTTYGPYPVSGDDAPWTSELQLEKGVDATATVGEKSFFMKCCNYMVYDHATQEIAESGALADYGLPCNIHAALEISTNVVGIIKYDQLWTVDLADRNMTGPVNANEALGLESIQLCGEHEDAGESISD